MALYHSETTFHYVSRSLGQILGYPRETVVSKGPAFLQHLILPKDRETVLRIIRHCEEALKRRSQNIHYPRISFDFHILTADGVVKRMYQHLLPHALKQKGQLYTLFILHDYTGFKSSPLLHYRLSYLHNNQFFQSLEEGKMAPACPYRLTRRELELCRQLALGQSIPAIAQGWSTSPETVKKIKGNLLKKTGARNTVSMLNEFLQNGWLE